MNNNNQANYIFWMLISNIISLTALIAAGMLAVKGVKGWGWFLVVSFLTATSARLSVKEEESDESHE